MKMMKKSRFIIAIMIVAFMIYMNYLTPMFADDFSYAVSWVTKEPMSSFWEVLQSQYLHYFTTNGRSVVHMLAQTVLCFGKPVVNVVNGLVFYIFCLLICFHGIGSFRKIQNWHILVVFSALWFLTPHFGGSYLWVMGAANYMYSPTMILLFLIPYRYWMDDKEYKNDSSILKAAFMFVGGVFAGWSNENTSLALIVMVGALLLYELLCKKKIYLWAWTGFVGNIIGCVLLFLSPAQAKRLEGAGGFGDIAEWIKRFVLITGNVLRYLGVLIILALIFAYIAWVKKKTKWIPAGIFFIGTGIAVYSMIGSPIFPDYVWSSILAFALICVLNLCTLVEWRKYTTAFAGILAVLVAVSCFQIFPELYRVKDEFAVREILIEKAVESKETLCVERITTESTYSSYSLFHELSTNEEIWPNTAVANYYNLPAIKVVDDK